MSEWVYEWMRRGDEGVGRSSKQVDELMGR